MRDFTADSLSARLNGTTHYQYDAVGHLLSAMQNGQEQAGYETDAVDNLVEIRQGNKKLSLIANGLNQIDRIESQRLQYDANGNLLNDGQRSYQWDGADRLIQITDLQTGISSEFTYDGYSRRTTEIEKDANGQITKALKNIWCGETLCAQQNATGQTINRFFAQGEVQNGKIYLYAQDQVGSVYVLIDSQGKVAGRTAYDPYGNITMQAGTQPIMAYAGLYQHKESGLHLATYRAYNSATARWLNRDPIKEAGGLNVYAYVGGDPVSRVDPQGLDWIYSQSTGQLLYEDKKGNQTDVAKGYAGHGEGVNNSSLQGTPNIGPIPQGTYTIEKQQNNVTGAGVTLKNSMRLTPNKNNTMFGRDGFLIHGDNSQGNQSASAGCIILSPTIRNKINNSGDIVLKVVP